MGFGNDDMQAQKGNRSFNHNYLLFDAQFGHGRALQMLDRFIEAVQAYHRALTIRPDIFTNEGIAEAMRRVLFILDPKAGE